MQAHSTLVRIGDVVDRTGISKDLIHHYLRQGLLPSCERRGLYDRQQVRLLQQIKILREDHHLPLDLIRQLFERSSFDPERIEALTLAESLGRRVADFTAGELFSPDRVSTGELAAALEVDAARIAVYVDAGLLVAPEGSAEPRWSSFDQRTVALCERGVALGIPFESFKTIAAHVQVAFRLEFAEFFDLGAAVDQPYEGFLADAFLRREIAASFVQNVLQALTLSHLQEILEATPAAGAGPEEILYRPSAAFVERHGLAEHADAAQAALQADPAVADDWLHAGEMLLHTGQQREAAFFLEQALGRWPGHRELGAALGRALVHAGDLESAIRHLQSLVDDGATDPRVPAYLALAVLLHEADRPHAERLLGEVARIEGLLDKAQAGSLHQGDDQTAALEARVIAGWVLTALPPLRQQATAGRALLRDVLRQLEAEPAVGELPGGHERLLISAAYLLLKAAASAPTQTGHADGGPPVDRPALVALVCQLDPASELARQAYLMAPRGPDAKETP